MTVRGAHIRTNDVLRVGGQPLRVVDVHAVSAQQKRRVDFADGNFLVFGVHQPVEVVRAVLIQGVRAAGGRAL